MSDRLEHRSAIGDDLISPRGLDLEDIARDLIRCDPLRYVIIETIFDSRGQILHFTIDQEKITAAINKRLRQ